MASKKRKPGVDEVFVELAKLSKRARLMADVEEFRVVPTMLRGFNRASRVGGAPLSCVWLVHGPSAGGKTALTCAVIKAIQAVGGIPVFIDAELAASTKKWFRALGIDGRRCVYIGRSDQSELERPTPLTYEEIVEEADNQVKGFQRMKRDGMIPPGTPLLVVIDSVSKMVPKETLKKLEKDGGDALRSGVGRLQAAMNTAWLLSLGPTVGDDDIIFALIAHEYQAASNGKVWTPDMKVRGGDALVYDSMVQVRVSFAGQVKDLAADDAPVVGKRHRVKFLKNKHGPAFGEAYFYTSTGDGMSPLGFDRPRELVHEAMTQGLIERPKEITLTKGSAFTWRAQRYQLKDLYEPDATELLASLEAALDAEIVESEEDAA